MSYEDIEALGGKFLTWPENGMTMRPPHDPEPGLRLSDGCPSSRILGFFEPSRIDRVSDGTALTGHLYADLFIQSSFDGMQIFDHITGSTRLGEGSVHVELPVPWSHGVSRLDAVVRDGPLCAHYELKTSSSKNPKLSKDIRSQVIRQRHAAALAGVELPALSVVFIIEKAGHMSGYVHGPFPIYPTSEELSNAAEEFDLVDLVMGDILSDGTMPRDHPLLPSLCKCGGCFKPEPTSASDAVLEIVDSDFERNFRRYKALSKWYRDSTDSLKDLLDNDSAVNARGFTISRTKTGRLLINERREDQ